MFVALVVWGSLVRVISMQWDVNHYQDKHSYVWKYGSSLVDEVRELVGGHSTYHQEEDPPCILDVGCGSGELTRELSETFPDFVIHGMDADANMIERAQAQFPDMYFFQQDIRTLRQQQQSPSLDNIGKQYDIIFSNAALHWVPPCDVERAVNSLAKSLKTGGHLVVEFGGKGNIQSVTKATIAALEEVGTETNNNLLASSSRKMEPFSWYFPSIGEFSSLLEKNGIEVTSATLYDRPTPLADGEYGLSNWMQMFGSKFLEVLDTPEQIQMLLNKVENKLRRSHLWNGGHWTLDYRRIRVVGVKTTTTTTTTTTDLLSQQQVCE